MNPALPTVETGWCTFQVADGLYGIEVARVHEVLRPQPLARVPLAPSAVAGLLNLRGQIVPAVDLRALFEAPPRESRGGFVVVNGPEGLTALVVDTIGDVRRLDVTLAPHEPGDGISCCAYTLALPDRLLTVLDVDRLLELAFERPGREPFVRSRPAAWRLPGE